MNRRSLLRMLGLSAPAAIAMSPLTSSAQAQADLDEHFMAVAREVVQDNPRFIQVSEVHFVDLRQGVKKPGGRLISSIAGQPGEVEWATHRNLAGNCGSWQIYLDGEDQRGFVAASEAEGWVLRDVIDEDGNFVLGMDEWVSEVVYGDVTVIALPGPHI